VAAPAVVVVGKLEKLARARLIGELQADLVSL